MNRDPKPDDICPRPDFLPEQQTQPLAPPIYPAAVYRCHDPDQAHALLEGEVPGYVYSRNGHPNADLLAGKCRELHGAGRAAICGTGMAALSAASLALLQAGERVVVSSRLYGQSLNLLTSELQRCGVTHEVVDTCDLAATRKALADGCGLLVVETITNPLLRVSDIAALADMVHKCGGKLLVDNTLAGPTVCRPLRWGADLVLESLTKIMNGHSDVNLGLLCGTEAAWDRIEEVICSWGLAASPFDCWLALRGLGTLAVRVDRASHNAQQAAEFLAARGLQAVHYPGLPDHPDHALAQKQLEGRCGAMVTFTLAGGRAAAKTFMQAAQSIPFSPSLGDLGTTLSHPQSTSHRKLSEERRQQLGICGGTIRLSVGIESPEWIIEGLTVGLDAVEAAS